MKLDEEMLELAFWWRRQVAACVRLAGWGPLGKVTGAPRPATTPSPEDEVWARSLQIASSENLEFRIFYFFFFLRGSQFDDDVALIPSVLFSSNWGKRGESFWIWC